MRTLGRASLLLLLALLSALPALGAKNPLRHKHAARTSILEMEGQWREAVLAGDADSLDALLSSDYMAISPEGTILTREQTLANLREKRIRFSSLLFEDVQIRFFANTAVVTTHVTERRILPQGESEGRFLHTRVYVRDSAGRWKVVHFEASRAGDATGKRTP